VLGNSYVFAFYMFGDLYQDQVSPDQNLINQNLFEDQQQQLESQVERLSQLLQDLDKKPADSSIRHLVVNCTRSVDTRCSKLYELIEDDLLGAVEPVHGCIAAYRGGRPCKTTWDELQDTGECVTSSRADFNGCCASEAESEGQVEGRQWSARKRPMTELTNHMAEAKIKWPCPSERVAVAPRH